MKHYLDNPDKDFVYHTDEFLNMKEKRWYADRIRKVGENPYLIFRYNGTKKENFKSKNSLVRLTTNDKAKTLSLDFNKPINPEPVGYLDSIHSMHSYLCDMTPSTFVYAYADSLYDYDLKKFISIPYKKGGGDFVHKYYGRFAMKNPFTQEYHLVYREDKTPGYYFMIFNKEGELIKNEKN